MNKVNNRELLFKKGIISIDDITISDSPQIEIVISEFISFLEAKGSAAETISLYKLALDSLKGYLNGRELELLHKNDFIPLMNFLHRQYQNSNTFNMRQRSINAFLNWAVENEKIKRLPFRLKQVTVNKKRPKYFTDSEMTDILNIIQNDGNSELFARVQLHVRTGMRLNELDTSYLDNGFIQVYQSKGHNARTIPVDEETGRYYQICKDGKYLPKSISKMFLRVIRQLKLHNTPDGDKRCFHCLRHTYAVKTYFRTKDIYAVCKLLGHSSVKTTEIYASFDDQQLARDFSDGPKH